MNDAYLILENGAVFKGKSFGSDAETVGELVFTTGMTGYLETLADPVYYGQIVLQTFPLIGNYGVIPPDFGPGPVHMKAYIVRDWCQEPSNFRSEGNLDSFLRKEGLPSLCCIDTRALTRIIRENGVMNAMVSKTPELSEKQWADLRGYKITDAVAACALKRAERKAEAGGAGGDSGGDSVDASRAAHAVSACPESRVPSSGFNVTIWDFGGASKLAEGLLEHGFSPAIVPYNATADFISAQNPDGVALSGGPGDPAENTHIIAEIEKLCGKGIPILGVGLGHQMLALARGAKTLKLPFGHRGSNQPVYEFETGRVFVTGQNHGYAVATDSLPACAVMNHVNSNDATCEGISYNDIPAFSVQFNPTDEVFAKFLLLKKG